MPTFDELVASLATVAERPTLATGPAVPPVQHVTDRNPRFVPPTFRAEIDLAEGTSVVLITAPAAVGKSTVAREIARLTNAPLFDLAQFQVGDSFIEGTITRAYGPQSLVSILSGVSDGDFPLIFDALDEGEVRAGGNNFEAFMENLCALAADPRPRPTIIVLARGETAVLTELHMEEQGVRYASFVIDYFDEAGARTYLELQLDEMARVSSGADRPHHHNHAAVFQEAVHLVFQGLARAVASDVEAASWNTPAVRAFLGYAPVLSVLAEFLRVGNYQLLCEDLRRSPEWYDGGRSSWAMLSEIVRALFVREQQKVVGNVRPKLALAADLYGFDDWDSLYTEDEQVVRILGRVLSFPIPERLPHALPGQLQDPYEDAIDIMLPQHPFIADRGFTSVVFEEYLYARTLHDGPSWLATAVRQRLHMPDSLPSPLLAHFMLESSPDTETPQINGEDVGSVYNSLHSNARRSGEVRLAVVEFDDAIQGFVWPDDDGSPILRFNITGELLTFWRRASYLVVRAPLDVEFLGVQDFRLGPDIAVEARSVTFGTADVLIAAGEDQEVTISAERYADRGAPPRLRVRGESHVGVYWPNLRFPWTAYDDLGPVEPDSDAVIERLYRHLRRILRGFRGSSVRGGTIGRSAHWIDPVAVGSLPEAKALRDDLVATKLLRIVGTRYVLETDRAAELGLDYTSLRTHAVPAAAKQYLQDFARRTGRLS